MASAHFEASYNTAKFKFEICFPSKIPCNSCHKEIAASQLVKHSTKCARSVMTPCEEDVSKSEKATLLDNCEENKIQKNGVTLTLHTDATFFPYELNESCTEALKDLEQNQDSLSKKIDEVSDKLNYFQQEVGDTLKQKDQNVQEYQKQNEAFSMKLEELEKNQTYLLTKIDQAEATISSFSKALDSASDQKDEYAVELQKLNKILCNKLDGLKEKQDAITREIGQAQVELDTCVKSVEIKDEHFTSKEDAGKRITMIKKRTDAFLIYVQSNKDALEKLLGELECPAESNETTGST